MSYNPHVPSSVQQQNAKTDGAHAVGMVAEANVSAACTERCRTQYIKGGAGIPAITYMSSTAIHTLGIDIGSTTVKVAVLAR